MYITLFYWFNDDSKDNGIWERMEFLSTEQMVFVYGNETLFSFGFSRLTQLELLGSFIPKEPRPV